MGVVEREEVGTTEISSALLSAASARAPPLVGLAGVRGRASVPQALGVGVSVGAGAVVAVNEHACAPDVISALVLAPHVRDDGTFLEGMEIWLRDRGETKGVGAVLLSLVGWA